MRSCGRRSPTPPPRTYLLLLTAIDAAGNRASTARDRPTRPLPAAPVVRVLGVDASFDRPELCARRRRDAAGGDRCAVASRSTSITRRARADHARRTRCTARRRDDRADRLGEPRGRAGHDPPAASATGRAASTSRELDAPRRTGRLRAVRRPPRPRSAPSRVAGRAPHGHVAGVQLLRRERRRLGRHVVRGAERPPRHARPTVHATAACRR